MQAEIDAADPHHGPGAVGASTLQKALARIQGDKAERIMSKYTVCSSGAINDTNGTLKVGGVKSVCWSVPPGAHQWHNGNRQNPGSMVHVARESTMSVNILWSRHVQWKLVVPEVVF